MISDLGGVNRAMAAWQPEAAPVTLRAPRAQRATRWVPHAFTWRPAYLALSLGAVAATLLLVTNLLTTERRARTATSSAIAAAPPADSISVVNRPLRRAIAGKAVDRFGAAPGGGGGGRAVPEQSASLQPHAPAETVEAPRQPSVIRTATLRLVAGDFNAARASVESIVAQAGGFLDQITVNGAPGAARTLTGIVRVPAARLADALTRLRQLGQVTEDTQGSDDVTDQLVDLDTRLANARAEEQRLNDILKNRTGKLSDVLEVEQQISRVRLEIEQMDAQRVNTARRVSYATITLQIDEIRKAGLESGPLSLATRVRIAAADGVESAVDTVVGTLLFVLRADPASLLWLGAAVIAWTMSRRIFHLKVDATNSSTPKASG